MTAATLLLAAPAQPVGLIPAWSDDTVLTAIQIAHLVYWRVSAIIGKWWLRRLIEAARIASLPEQAQAWEREWQQIEDEGERIDHLWGDVQTCVKHWAPDWKRADLVDGHYLRKGELMIFLGHPNTGEKMIANPGHPEDVHRGEIVKHYKRSKIKRVFKVNEQVNIQWRAVYKDL